MYFSSSDGASIGFPYFAKFLGISLPSFDSAVANGISFGNIPLTPYPTKEIDFIVDFFESDPVTQGQIRIFGDLWNDAEGIQVAGAIIRVLADGVQIASGNSDSLGNYYITATMTEDAYNNIGVLEIDIDAVDLGTATYEQIQGSNLPTYAVATSTGISVGTTYITQ